MTATICVHISHSSMPPSLVALPCVAVSGNALTIFPIKPWSDDIDAAAKWKSFCKCQPNQKSSKTNPAKYDVNFRRLGRCIVRQMPGFDRTRPWHHILVFCHLRLRVLGGRINPGSHICLTKYWKLCSLDNYCPRHLLWQHEKMLRKQVKNFVWLWWPPYTYIQLSRVSFPWQAGRTRVQRIVRYVRLQLVRDMWAGGDIEWTVTALDDEVWSAHWYRFLCGRICDT